MPRKLIHEQRFFLSIFAIYILAGAGGFFYYEQGNEVLFFNRHHNDLLDFLFANITRLAEWQVLTILSLILFLSRIKFWIIYLLDLMITGIVIGILKAQFFADRIRPALYFSSTYNLHFVKGVPVFTQYSFPSGHTATAFAVFFLLAILIRKTWASIVLLALAMLVGLSRIYLLQHFWIDVYFGSVIGILVTLILYISIQHPILHNEHKWLNFSIYEKYIKGIGG